MITYQHSFPRTYTDYRPMLGSEYADGCGVMRVTYPRSGQKKSPKPWKCGIDFDEKRVAARTGLKYVPVPAPSDLRIS